MKVAVFDLCGTLFDCNTLFAFTRWACPASAKRAFADSLLMKLWDRIDPQLHRRRNMHLSLLAPFSQAELEYLAEAFYRRVLQFKALPQVHRLRASLQDSGWYTILATAAPEFLARVAERHLGFYDCFASAYEAGKLTEDLTYRKYAAVRAYLPAEALLTVSDNLTDLRLLKLSDTPVVVCRKKDVKKWKKRLPQARFLLK